MEKRTAGGGRDRLLGGGWQMSVPDESDRICFVNCGLPGDQCACYRAQMRELYADLAAGQKRLEPEFERAWSDNVESLYEE